MIFITGETRAHEFVKIIQENGWGRMVTTRRIKPYPGEPYAIDNGAYSCFTNKKPWKEADFLKLVKVVEGIGPGPYMAITPDIVAGGLKSLQMSNEWIERPELQNNFPWYLAVQNGMRHEWIEDAITKYPYAGIFVGGDNRFKRNTSTEWIALGHKYGLKVHIGRVGTPRKIRWANDIGADSCDSSFPLWCKERIHKVIWTMDLMDRTKATAIT